MAKTKAAKKKKSPAPDQQPKRKVGRPSKFTPELATEICEAIATSDMGIHRLCKKHKHFPDPVQIFRWLMNDEEDEGKREFRKQYARARDIQAEFMRDKMNEVVAPKAIDKRGFGVGAQIINRDKLIADTFKWQMSKLAPKVWGDKLQVDQTIKTEPPLFPEVKKDSK